MRREKYLKSGTWEMCGRAIVNSCGENPTAAVGGDPRAGGGAGVGEAPRSGPGSRRFGAGSGPGRGSAQGPGRVPIVIQSTGRQSRRWPAKPDGGRRFSKTFKVRIR